MAKEIILKLTEQQADVLMSACDFYARILCGQFQEIPYKLFMEKTSEPGYQDRRTTAEQALLDAKKAIFPELDRGFGHHYGMGH